MRKIAYALLLILLLLSLTYLGYIWYIIATHPNPFGYP